MENFCRFDKSKNCYLNNCCKNCNFYENRLKTNNINVAKRIKEDKKEEGFNAQNTTINIAVININCKDTPCMFAFENYVKEDKMENRIVKKLEDLDGLENGMGLRVVVSDVSDSEDYKNISVSVYKVDCRIADIKGNAKKKLETLKSMGFKFEYKPLDKNEEKLEKILESVEDVEAKNNIRNIFKIQKEFFEELKEIMGVGK
ncbi:hypothetical protein [Cetobacterium sp.]|uniref:hypothetical protein n=1 Tax=Cetobacterium sp. TaxID=2071632 RepID=UPI003F30DC25